MAATTYAKAAAALVPGAGRLPWVPGGGSEIPDLTLERSGVVAEPGAVAAYARVCGFRLRDELPATYPHVLAFDLHMQLMTDGRFPFGAIGLVHVENRITVRRALRVGEPFDLRVRATPLEPHPKGRTFSIVSEALVDGEVVWEDESTMLRRGGGGGDGERSSTARRRAAPAPPPFVAEWTLPGDLGRRYAAVSGDQNPIHLHPLSARLFGFPRAIAHGMWTKARCLAALERDLPDRYTVEVAFKKPILLPGKVVFGSEGAGGRGKIRFGVRSAKDESTVHLDGTVRRS
jgi:acyl dehydratase